LRREHDVVRGTRTRTFVMAILGVFFTGVPLLVQIDPGGILFKTSYATHIAWSCGFMALVAGFAYWARETMMSTVLNRRSVVALQGLFVAQILLFATAWRLDISLLATEVLMMFLWVVVSGLAALAIDRRLAGGFVAYLAGFLIALPFPAQRFYIMSSANFVFTICVIYE